MTPKESPLIDTWRWEYLSWAYLYYMNKAAMKLPDEGKSLLLLWAGAGATSVMTFNFEAYAKVIYPNTHIVLIFWQRENVGHHGGPSMMGTLLWVVVIDHTVFLVRKVFFWYIWIKVKDRWFDIGYIPRDYSYTKTFFGVTAVKGTVGVCPY